MKHLLEAELRPDECLVWSEQPDPMVHARRRGPVLLFAIPWLAFVSFFTLTAPANTFMLLFASVFWAFGLLLLTIPWWAKAEARRTIYAITNERVLLLTCWRKVKVTSFAPSALGELQGTERKDGSGDLVLRRRETSDSDGMKIEEVGFFGIRDVNRIRRLVQDLHIQARDAAVPCPVSQKPVQL